MAEQCSRLRSTRLVGFDEHRVRFRYKDYAAANRRKVMALAPQQFIRCYLLHVLPKGFMRIRHYGLLGNRTKQHKLAQARTALNAPQYAAVPGAPETIEAFCHSALHRYQPLNTAPSAPCPTRPAFVPCLAATACMVDLIQIPKIVAQNPAVQSNKFYPPCCRTADKTLFVMRHRATPQ